MTIDKVKKKPLPPYPKYEPPCIRKKRKTLGSWFEMFKWNPKAVGHDVENCASDLSWKRCPLDSEGHEF